MKRKLREDYQAQRHEEKKLRLKKQQAAKVTRAKEQKAQSQKEREDMRVLATVQQAKQRYQHLVKEQMKLLPWEYFDRLYHDFINKGRKENVLEIVDKVLLKEVTIMERSFGEVLQWAGY
ncbi:hypothetical protein VKT23_019453 [Stygiomarasmius scandens]|uniref:Uncharacterized protein n=1 Tax=Marasmiellus scandens TaxID=2682957 RepID=A0ABR1ILC4_9AGAR